MGVKIEFDWSGARDVPAQPVNVFLVQGLGDQLTISLGHAPPPAAAADLNVEGLIDFYKEHSVAVQQIGRFALPLDTARFLADRLQAALVSYDSQTEPPPAKGEVKEAAS